jgi:hypothetical protein
MYLDDSLRSCLRGDEGDFVEAKKRRSRASWLKSGGVPT